VFDDRQKPRLVDVGNTSFGHSRWITSG
jgi:hypothetical protein